MRCDLEPSIRGIGCFQPRLVWGFHPIRRIQEPVPTDVGRHHKRSVSALTLLVLSKDLDAVAAS